MREKNKTKTARVKIISLSDDVHPFCWITGLLSHTPPLWDPTHLIQLLSCFKKSNKKKWY